MILMGLAWILKEAPGDRRGMRAENLLGQYARSEANMWTCFGVRFGWKQCQCATHESSSGQKS